MKKRIKRLKDERMLVKSFWSETFLSETKKNRKKKKKKKERKKEKKTVLGVITNYIGSHREIL